MTVSSNRARDTPGQKGARKCKRFSEMVNLCVAKRCVTAQGVLYFVHFRSSEIPHIHAKINEDGLLSHPFRFGIKFGFGFCYCFSQKSRGSFVILHVCHFVLSVQTMALRKVVVFTMQVDVVVVVAAVLFPLEAVVSVCVFKPQFTQIGWRIFRQWQNTVWKFIKVGSFRKSLVRIVLCLFLCEVH